MGWRMGFGCVWFSSEDGARGMRFGSRLGGCLVVVVVGLERGEVGEVSICLALGVMVIRVSRMDVSRRGESVVGIFVIVTGIWCWSLKWEGA